jgi:hypothetical protein
VQIVPLRYDDWHSQQGQNSFVRTRSKRLAVAVAVTLAGGGGALALSVGSSGPPPGMPPGGAVSVASSPGSPSGSSNAAEAAGAVLPVSSTALGVIAATPALANAPWIFQPGGSPTYSSEKPRPSLVFPPNFTYPEALRALYNAVVQTGKLPDGAALGPPLPDGKVVSYPADPKGGLSLDLRAPWGYSVPGGAIAAPSLAFPADWTPSEVNAAIQEAKAQGLPIPHGAFVYTPSLPDCQISHGEAGAAAC